MAGSSREGTGQPLRLALGPRRTALLPVRGYALQVVTWRLAVGWRGPAAGEAALVLPIALVERRGAQQRWRLVPDLTLAVTLLGMGLAAWIALAPGRERV